MQPYSLTVDKFIDHAAEWFSDRELVEAEAGEAVHRFTYGDLRWRSIRLSGALASLGLRQGDRIATLAWNTRNHLEVYYAAMGVGLVCHTLNPRLTAEHLSEMIAEAEDRVLAVSADLMPLARELVKRSPVIEHLVVLDARSRTFTSGTAGVRIWDLENLVDEHGRDVAWGAFDEYAPAGLCYTSGTTGRPKGVLYTHRSNYLHTLRLLQADSMALRQSDVVLLAVPMFHANGWGLPFAAPAVGSKLLLPGRHADGASLAKLMRDEGATVGIGVQTVWLGVVEHLEQTGQTLPKLESVIIGGSSCPANLVRRMEEGLGAEVQTSWGMTELSPLGTISPPGAPRSVTSGAGRAPIGLDLKLVDASGNRLAEQRNQLGYLRVKGASVIDRYFGAEEGALDEEGFFDTGDLATIDDDGNLNISGRSKDLIKSGGEWINPAEIEEIIGSHPDVDLVAVISIPHDKWGERPLLIVQPRAGIIPDWRLLIEELSGRVADWWIPEHAATVEFMPLSGSGKIDKSRLREEVAAGAIVGDPISR